MPSVTRSTTGGRALRPARASDDGHLARLDETLIFMRVLWSLQHSMQRASKRMKKTSGVTGPQRLVLRIVGTAPGISAGQVARILHLDKSTLTGVIQRLHTGGLLTRRADPRDGRSVRLHLTAKGNRLNEPGAHGTVEEAARSSLATVSHRSIKAAVALLEDLADRLLEI